jgi:hypothetical protein
MPALRPGHQRESIDGGAVEPVLHHLPGIDCGARMREIARMDCAEVAQGMVAASARQRRVLGAYSGLPLPIPS